MHDQKDFEDSELLPCPFCGGEAECFEHTKDINDQYRNFLRTENWWEIVCTGCEIEFRFEDGEAGAIKAWNTRPTPTSDAKEVLEACDKLWNLIKSETHNHDELHLVMGGYMGKIRKFVSMSEPKEGVCKHD